MNNLQIPPQLTRLTRENIQALEKCDFDLCSSCADKEDIENVCSKGHQLHPVKLGVNYRNWICDGCERKFSSEGKGEEDVVVWRCEQDWRYEGGEQIRPGGAQAVENIGVDAQYDEDLQLALALSLSHHMLLL